MTLERFKKSVAADSSSGAELLKTVDVSRRTSNPWEIKWRELTFAATA